MKLSITDKVIKLDGENTTLLIQLDHTKPAISGNAGGRWFVSRNMALARPSGSHLFERLRFAAVIFAYIAFGYRRGFILVEHYQRQGAITPEHIADIGVEIG